MEPPEAMEVVGSSTLQSPNSTISTSDEEPVRVLPTTSSDKGERIRARQERIRKRLEYNAKKDTAGDGGRVAKDTGGVDGGVEKVGDETDGRGSPPLAADCLQTSAQELYKLEVESEEMITNVRIANEAKEVMRRKQDQEDRKRRLEILEEESKQAQEQFQEISSRWSQISKMNDPLNIHNECEAQRQRCTELLKQKNNMIKVLKEDLEKCDEKYREDMENQNEDVNLLISRIEHQMKLLRKAYWYNLDLLQHAIHVEFKEFLEAKQKLWNRLFTKRNKLEQKTVEEKIETQKLYDEQLHELRLSYEDEFRQKKIEYENQIQKLELELEQLKPNCLQLKLAFEYNFTLVQKRVEENMYNHSQQKRRNNKLNDLVMVLRQKAKQTREKSERDVKKLKDEIAKLNSKTLKIENISKQLYQENEIKYRQLWCLNQKEAEIHLQKILQTDKTIYEQFLGINWEPPIHQLFKKEDFLPSKKVNANNLDSFLLGCPQLSLETESKRRRIYECVKQALTQHADFLNDPKLNNVLQPYSDETETLVKLNNVLDNLGIESMVDVNVLVDFMKPYIYCNQCKEQLSRTGETVRFKPQDEPASEHEMSEIALIHSKRINTITPFIQSYEIDFADFAKVSADTTVVLPDILSPPSRTSSSHTTISRKTKTSITRAKSLTDIIAQSNLSLIVDTKVVDDFQGFRVQDTDDGDYFKTEFTCSVSWGEDNVMKFDEARSETKTRVDIVTRPTDKTYDSSQYRKTSNSSVKDTLVPFICSNDSHQLSIESSDVPNAIKQFIREYKSTQVDTTKDVLSTPPKEKRIDKIDVERYWNQFLKLFPDEKIELWNSVFKSLEKYHQVLMKRQKLNEELGCLSSRNKHLRTLLQSYIKPDAELKSESLPPIHVTDTVKKTSFSKYFV
ncbi:hypothetical protein M8J76_000824 [Diaphorina citri]|nr:hypothetical protein M8J76_000824 [Diaphorina citri]